jgi:hypothetical protein
MLEEIIFSIDECFQLADVGWRGSYGNITVGRDRKHQTLLSLVHTELLLATTTQ